MYVQNLLERTLVSGRRGGGVMVASAGAAAARGDLFQQSLRSFSSEARLQVSGAAAGFHGFHGLPWGAWGVNACGSVIVSVLLSTNPHLPFTGR